MTSRLILLAACAVVVAAGCGRKVMPANPKTVAVRGTVVFGSAPLNGGRLAFYDATKSGADEDAFAEIENDGSFKPSTYAEFDGLPKGTYVVTISPRSYKGKNGMIRMVNEDRIPAEYRKRESSPWKITVEDGKEQLDPLVIGK
jgi:hypothetical protein